MHIRADAELGLQALSLTLAVAERTRPSPVSDYCAVLHDRDGCISWLFHMAGLPRLVTPEFTASLRPVPPGLVVTDESLIPDTYWVPQPPKLSRQEVLAALKAGTSVSGAALSNGGPHSG